jgi:hypothetical protein
MIDRTYLYAGIATGTCMAFILDAWFVNTNAYATMAQIEMAKMFKFAIMLDLLIIRFAG